MKTSTKHFSLLLGFMILLFASSVLPVSAASSPGKVQKLKTGATTPNSINLSWKSQKGISGYQVYRAFAYDGKYKRLMTVNPEMHAFCNRNLKSGTEYYYKVRAFTKSGNKIRYGKFSNILAAHTKTTSKKAVPTTWANVRKHAGTNHPVITTVSPDTSVTILCTTQDKSGNSWSRIQCSVKGKTIKGYIRSNLLKEAKKANKSGIVTAFLLNVRKYPDASSSIIGTLNRGHKVTVLGTKKGVSGTSWYYIRYTKNGRTKKGYVSTKYIKISYPQ